MTIGVFRTYKGDIEKGVLGTLAVRNPKTGKKAEVRLFESKEYVIDVQNIPREFRTPGGREDRPVQGHGQRRPGGGLAAMRRAVSSISAPPRPTCTSAPPTPRSP